MAFTDEQLNQVLSAAKLLSSGNSRNAFLRSVANRLVDVLEPTDQDVTAAIAFVLNCHGVAIGKHLSCVDAVNKQKEFFKWQLTDDTSISTARMCLLTKPSPSAARSRTDIR